MFSIWSGFCHIQARKQSHVPPTNKHFFLLHTLPASNSNTLSLKSSLWFYTSISTSYSPSEWIARFSLFVLWICLFSHNKVNVKKVALSLCGSSLPPPSPLFPAVLLNTGICVSVAGSVDQLSCCGGGHSKAVCSMSIRPQLSFEAPGCQSTSLIRPQWDQNKPQQLMQMCSGLDSLSSHVVCLHKHRLWWFWMLTALWWSHRIKLLADKMTTHSGHSDDLRGGRQQSQRDRGPVSPPDLLLMHTHLREEQNRFRTIHWLLLP